ncbi:MAG: ABC transporter ATP-binding protein [Actinobacteria bacterium]|nr:ABC transporter ATP-binding protein [Actinomycetota bacterium]
MSLILKNVSVVSDKDGVILDDISFEFKPGRIYILIGRTTSGKTSLMRAIAGLLPITSGEITMNGENLDSQPIWERDVAVVYQQFINYPNKSVLQNVEFPLLRKGLSKPEARELALASINKVGLNDYIDRKPAQLSGGQQQRVALARSLARKSRIMLLDEPLMNLDYKLREQLRVEFKEIFNSQADAVTIYATTEPPEALILGAEILVLHEGRIIQFGSPTEVYEKPLSTSVARVISDPPMSILPVSISAGEVKFEGGYSQPIPTKMKNVKEGRYQVGIRANDIVTSKSGGKAENGTISLVEVSGSETLVYVDTPAGEVVLQMEGIHDVKVGESISIELPGNRMFLFETNGALCVSPDNAGE